MAERSRIQLDRVGVERRGRVGEVDRARDGGAGTRRRGGGAASTSMGSPGDRRAPPPPRRPRPSPRAPRVVDGAGLPEARGRGPSMPSSSSSGGGANPISSSSAAPTAARSAAPRARGPRARVVVRAGRGTDRVAAADAEGIRLAVLGAAHDLDARHVGPGRRARAAATSSPATDRDPRLAAAVLLVVRERDVAHVADAVRRRRRGRPRPRAGPTSARTAGRRRPAARRVRSRGPARRSSPPAEGEVRSRESPGRGRTRRDGRVRRQTLSAGRSTTPPRNAMRILTMASLQSFMR